MSKTIIKAENLGKKYLISHAAETPQYSTLRDKITKKINGLGKKTNRILKGHQLLNGSEIEEFWALKGINFEVKQGERLGIIGRNGAGKSTLLKVLSRITEPSEGRVTIRGKVASLLEVGTGFHPELSGRENIFLNGAILGMGRTEIKQKFDEIVSFAEIEKFLDTPVKRYSSGMYVRLAFAVAAHLEPEILIVDEVLAVGDAKFQKKCLGKMQDISNSEGRTILFVSHNISAVKNITTKAIYLKKGLIAAQGETNQIVQKYISDLSSLDMEVQVVAAYRRTYRNPLATIDSILVNGEEGTLTTILLSQKLEIIININAIKDLPKTILNIIIKNDNQETVTTISSNDDNFQKNLIKGENQIKIIINQNIFAPNIYFATFGLSPPNGGLAYDVIKDYPLFEIKNNGQIDYWLDRPFGGVILQNLSWV